MSTNLTHDPSRTGDTDPRIVYGMVGALLAVLLVVMLIAFDYHRDDTEARAKADRLIAAYEAEGYRSTLTSEQLADVLGTDGGTVCATAGSDTALGHLKTQIGVGGEFYVRPILLDGHVWEGLRLIVEIYCPENLENVREFIADQRYAE